MIKEEALPGAAVSIIRTAAKTPLIPPILRFISPSKDKSVIIHLTLGFGA